MPRTDPPSTWPFRAPTCAWRRLALAAAAALALGAAGGCSGGGPTAPGPAPAPRSYLVGLTPFPHEPTGPAFEEAFDFAGAHGDLLANHLDNGVPWDSALAGRPPQPDVIAELDLRAARATGPGLRHYIALTWLSTFRDSIAGGWNGAPRPPAIQADPTFANPAVRRALKFWCAWVATRAAPDVMAPCIEVNLYAHWNPSDWPHFASLYREVYDTLKTLRPAMPVFPTWQADYLWEWNGWGLVPDVEPAFDRLAYSLYPGGRWVNGRYLTPATIPADYLGHGRTLTAKPMCIAETGFGDSAVASPGGGTPYPGSPSMQRDYVAWVARQADSLAMTQVVWFFGADPWGVLEAQTPALLDAIRVFGPMGLRKRSLAAKPALAEWDAMRARPYRP